MMDPTVSRRTLVEIEVLIRNVMRTMTFLSLSSSAHLILPPFHFSSPSTYNHVLSRPYPYPDHLNASTHYAVVSLLNECHCSPCPNANGANICVFECRLLQPVARRRIDAWQWWAFSAKMLLEMCLDTEYPFAFIAGDGLGEPLNVCIIVSVFRTSCGHPIPYSYLFHSPRSRHAKLLSFSFRWSSQGCHRQKCSL